MIQIPNLRTRYAPTPSGYLHIGNSWSFLLTWLWARSQGGSIHLRIDDLDSNRFRKEYLDDIFTSLEWLGFDWDTGPKNSEDFLKNYSQQRNHCEYRQALDVLMQKNLSDQLFLYTCNCTRKQLINRSESNYHATLYPKTCQYKNLPLEPAPLWQSGKGSMSLQSHLAIRFSLLGDKKVFMHSHFSTETILHPSEELGDFIIWQKNGKASYHFASVLDDERLGINFVVRGRDLLASTSGQLYLAAFLNAHTFEKAIFFHHGLVLANSEEKISKSNWFNHSWTLKSWRENGGSSEKLFYHFAKYLGMEMGDRTGNFGDAKGKISLQDLLKEFDPNKCSLNDLSAEAFTMLN